MTVGHKLVRTPCRDPLLPTVHPPLPPTLRIRLSVFSDTCTLFHFWDHSYPASFPQVAHSSAKNRGYPPPVKASAKGLSAKSSVTADYLLYFPYIRIPAWYVFCFPYIRKKGGHPLWKMSARRHCVPWHSHSWLCTRSAGNQQGTGKNACATRHQSQITSLPVAAPAEAGRLLCYPIYRRPFLP